MKPLTENAPTANRGANQNNNLTRLHPHSTPNTDEGIVVGYELIPAGKYPVTFDSHDFINPPGLGHRIRLWFAITDSEYAGIPVPYFCTVTITNRKKGSFTIRKGSKYFTTMNALTGRQGQRPDRYSPSLLKGMKLLANVVTVDKRKDGTPYPKEDCYSKVFSLERKS